MCLDSFCMVQCESGEFVFESSSVVVFDLYFFEIPSCLFWVVKCSSVFRVFSSCFDPLTIELSSAVLVCRLSFLFLICILQFSGSVYCHASFSFVNRVCRVQIYYVIIVYTLKLGNRNRTMRLSFNQFNVEYREFTR